MSLLVALSAGSAWAQSGNPRFGKWKLKSDAQAPASNIMTYEPYQGTGMRITIDAVNARGERSQWGHTTMFDGKDEPLYGNPNTDTGAVRQISDRVNEIVYKKNGVGTQILTNVLSPDGRTIGVCTCAWTRRASTSRTSRSQRTRRCSGRLLTRSAVIVTTRTARIPGRAPSRVEARL